MQMQKLMSEFLAAKESAHVISNPANHTVKSLEENVKLLSKGSRSWNRAR